MGNTASKSATKAVRTAVRTVPSFHPPYVSYRILTFDALGTIYDFKEPVARQYLRIARKCGVKHDISEARLQEAFGIAYKRTTKELPNYGKHSKYIKTPEAWWDMVVNRTFGEVMPKESIPADLGLAAYRHFASGAAYKLLKDGMRAFEEDLHYYWRRGGLPHWEVMNARGGTFKQYVPGYVGVVTNSDPRVIGILRDLGLKVGTPPPAPTNQSLDLSAFNERDYNVGNHIDFVCTSYDADSEKPSRGIFDYAARCAISVNGAHKKRLARSISNHDNPAIRHTFQHGKEHPEEWFQDPAYIDPARWFHVGNDFEKDCLGAAGAGLVPVYLSKDPEWNKAKQLSRYGGFTVGRLIDVGDAVSD